MGACRFVQEGNIIDWLNDSGADLTAGQSIKFNSIVVVIDRDVPQDRVASGRVAKSPIVEAYKDPVDAEAYQMGEVVYWNSVSGKAVKVDPGANGHLLGHAVPGAGGTVGGGVAADGCAATGDALVRVRLTDLDS